MKIATDHQLSSELQELYLENKQWFSDVLFLEDEIRFFQKLFGNVLSSIVKDGQVTELQLIKKHLNNLDQRKSDLKILIENHQDMIKDFLKHENKQISLNLILENTKIVTEIKELFKSEKLLKKELYMLVEEVMIKSKVGHLISF